MISQNIATLRHLNGLTQEELAGRLGVSRQSVAKWESGESVPDLANAQMIAELFNVSLDDLVTHSEQAAGFPVPPRGKHIFGIVRMGERGQIVIPKKARDVFELSAGSELLVLGDESQGIALQKVEDAEVMLEAYGRAIEMRSAGAPHTASAPAAAPTPAPNPADLAPRPFRGGSRS